MARITNDGPSYGLYVRQAEPYEDLPFPLDNQQEETFISSDKCNAEGIEGIPMGDGLYLHTGVPPEREIVGYSDDCEFDDEKVASRSRLETVLAYKGDDNPITGRKTPISASPRFDFTTKRAEMIVHYSDGSNRVLKASAREILDWLHVHTIVSE